MLNNDIFEEEMLTQVKLKKARMAVRTVIDNAQIEQE